MKLRKYIFKAEKIKARSKSEVLRKKGFKVNTFNLSLITKIKEIK